MIHPEHHERIVALHETTKQVLAERQVDKHAKIAIRKAKQAKTGFPSDKSPI
jgi:hypothetical protein